jgi:hypothetical protein
MEKDVARLRVAREKKDIESLKSPLRSTIGDTKS